MYAIASWRRSPDYCAERDRALQEAAEIPQAGVLIFDRHRRAARKAFEHPLEPG